MRTKSITGRLVIILKFSLAGILLLFMALAVYIATFDINNYREQLQSQASSVLGREVILEGPLSMALSPSPTIVIEQLHIKNLEWASRPHLANIDVLKLELELLPLLVKKIKITNIDINKADILLETNVTGEHNWTFLEDRMNQPGADGIDLRQIEVKDSIITIRDGGKITEIVVINKARIARSFLYPLKMEVSASYNGLPVLFEMQTGSLAQLSKSEEKSSFKLHVVAGDNRLDLDGAVTNLASGRELTGDVNVRGKKISELLPELDSVIPDSVEYDLAARMTATLSGLEIAGLKGDLVTPLADREIHISQGKFAVGKQTSLSSHISLEYAGMPIEASLSAVTLDEMRTGVFPAQGLIQAKSSSMKFNGTVKNIFVSPQVEFDVSVQGDDFIFIQTLLARAIPDLGAYKLDMHLSASQDKYKARITSASLPGLAVKGALSVDASSEPVRVSADLSSKSINLSPFRKTLTAGKQTQPVSILDKAFELNLPQNAEFDLRLRTGKVTGLDTPLNDVDVTLLSSSKQFVVSPLKFKAPGIAVNAKVSVRPVAKHYAISADIVGSKLDIDKLESVFGQQSKIQGKANKASLKLDGMADNLRDLLINGNIQASLTGAQFDYATGSDEHQTLVIDKLTAESLSGKPIAVTYSGNIKALPVTGEITIDRLVDRMQHISPMPVRLASKLADANISIRGSLGDIYPVHDMDLTVELNGKRLKSLEPVLGVGLSEAGPYTIAGHITKHADAYVLSGLKGKINQSDFSGTASIKSTNNRPLIVANIQADKFAYYDIFSHQKRVETSADKHVIPDLIIPFSTIKSVDAKLDISSRQFIVGDVLYDNLLAHADLRDGKLVLKPFQASLSGGQLNSHFILDSRDKTPVVIFSADGTDVDYGGLLETFGLTDKVKGVARVKLNINGTGTSTRELLAKSNGYIEIISGKGKIDQSKLDLWAADLITHSLTSAWQPEKAAEVNCTVARIDIRDGIAHSDIMLLDTTRITVAGSGNLNLSSEELNLLFIPSPKNPSFVSLAKPAQMTGYLSDPQVALVPGSKTWMLGGFLAGLANPATLLIMYGKTGNLGANPCLDAVKLRENTEEEAIKKGQPVPDNLPFKLLKKLFNPFGG